MCVGVEEMGQIRGTLFGSIFSIIVQTKLQSDPRVISYPPNASAGLA